MSDILAIAKSIRSGWLKTVSFHMNATEKQWENYRPEYLTTVGIAQSIIKKNTYFGFPYCVRIEEPTKRAFENCFDPVKIQNKFPRSQHNIIYRKNVIHKGRFDIVIYQKPIQSYREEMTKWVIEVKNFNPSNSAVHKDLHRIIRLADTKDDVSENSFNAGFLTMAFNRNDDKDNCQIKNNILYKYADIKIKHPEFKFLFDAFLIHEYIPKDEYDLHEFHKFFGLTIIIKKRLI